MYNNMKKSVDVNDLLRQKDDMKMRTNKDAEYFKEYNRILKKIQYLII